MKRRLELCKSRALGFRPFLRRCANKVTTGANQCRSALWGCLRHNPVEVRFQIKMEPSSCPDE